MHALKYHGLAQWLLPSAQIGKITIHQVSRHVECDLYRHAHLARLLADNDLIYLREREGRANLI